MVTPFHWGTEDEGSRMSILTVCQRRVLGIDGIAGLGLAAISQAESKGNHMVQSIFTPLVLFSF